MSMYIVFINDILRKIIIFLGCYQFKIKMVRGLTFYIIFIKLITAGNGISDH